MKRLFEVCAGNMASVEAAANAAAERIELCSALHIGGITPPLDTLKQARTRFPDMIIHVLIRPRGGNFVYNKEEVDSMVHDITDMLPWADGIVCGALTADADIDISAMRRLIHAAQGKPFTFHRAFDVCRRPFEVLDQIIELGCDRVLTSGQRPTAEQGIDLLSQLQEYAAGRIIIMPGGGVTSVNARRILDLTKCHEIHGSASLETGITRESEVRRILSTLK